MIPVGLTAALILLCLLALWHAGRDPRRPV